MKSNVELVVVFVLMNLGSALSQGQRADSGSRPLPQWLTGIIAVVGFLFLTFAAFLIKRVWCENSKPRDMEAVRTKEKENDYVSERMPQKRDSVEIKTYTNPAMDDEDKVTAM